MDIGLETGGTKCTVVSFPNGANGDYCDPLELRRPGNFHAIGPEGMRDLGREILDTFCIKAEAVRLVAGVAGMDSPSEQVDVERCFLDVGFRASSMRVLNDARLMLEAVGDGLLLVAGTGSNCYGRYQGQEVHIGGYGYVLDDEGSGFYIGRRTINEVIHSIEGRGCNEETTLTSLVLSHFKVSDIRELGPKIYPIEGKSNAKAKIAALTSGCFDAAQTGDKIALKIVQEAAKRLGDIIEAAIVKLKLPQEPDKTVSCRVGLRGGIFRNAQTESLILRPIRERIKKCGVAVDFLDLENDSTGEPHLVRALKEAFSRSF